MASEIMNETQISLIVNDLIKDLDELKEVCKAQGERIEDLENRQRELDKKTGELETKVRGSANSQETIRKIDVFPFEVVLERKVVELKEAIQKRPAIH